MLPGKIYRPEDYLEILWRRKWWGIVPFVAIALGTLGFTQLLPDVYRADARVLIIAQQVPENFVQPTVTSGLNERLQAIQQQILSRTRLERIIQDLNLYPNERRSMIMEDVVELMRRNIILDIPRTRGRAEPTYFNISFRAENARSAMQVTERLASQFITENLQDRTIQAEQTSQFLETQLDDARRKLTEYEQKLTDFQQQHAGELPAQVQSNISVMQSSQIQLQQLADAMNRDRDRQLVLEKSMNDLSAISASQPAPARSAQGGPVTLTDQLASARAALEGLRLRLKPEHPDLMRAQRVVRDLEQKAHADELNGPLTNLGETRGMSAADQRQLSSMQAEHESLSRQMELNRAEQDRLQKVLASYRTRIEAAPAWEAAQTELMRDYYTIQENYTTLLTRSQQSKMAADLERRQIGEQFRVIDPARLPERPISPDRARMNMMGALGGLAFGLALIALLEYRDTTFRTDEDVTLSLALPVVAVIPAILTDLDRSQRHRRRLLALSASAVATCLVVAVAVWKFDTITRWIR